MQDGIIEKLDNLIHYMITFVISFVWQLVVFTQAVVPVTVVVISGLTATPWPSSPP
jgi:ATP-binding cassette subfamily B (MDR/TAP) protein 1